MWNNFSPNFPITQVW